MDGKADERSRQSAMLSEQALGPKPELAESTPQEDSEADASNAASLYKVSGGMRGAQVFKQRHQRRAFSDRSLTRPAPCR